jgi:BioD-like phosphotransacetylase family protein
VLERIGPGSLLILPGDRQDIISAAVAANRTQLALRRHPGRWDRLRHRSHFGRASSDPSAVSLAGLVFSGGFRPRERDLDAIREAGLFAYLLGHETYDVASEVHDLLVKTHPADTAKIEETKRLVTDHFDVDALLERLDQHSEAARRRVAVRTPSDVTGARPTRWLRAALDRVGMAGSGARR